MATLYALLSRIYPSGYPQKWSDWPTELVLEAVDLDTMMTQASTSLGNYGPAHDGSSSFAVSPTHQRVFVVDQGDPLSPANTLLVFDTVGGLIGSVPGRWGNFVLSPDESVLYVFNALPPGGAGYGVSAVNSQDLSVLAHVEVPTGTRYLALSSDGGTLALVHDAPVTAADFVVVDTSTFSVTDAFSLLPYAASPLGEDNERDSVIFAPDRDMFVIRGIDYHSGFETWTGGVQMPGLQTVPRTTVTDGYCGRPPYSLAYSEQSSRAYVPGGSAEWFGGDGNDPLVYEVEPGVTAVSQIGGLNKVPTIPCVDESHEIVFFAMRPPWPPQLQPAFVEDLPHTLGRYAVNHQQFDEDVYTFTRPDLSVIAMQVVGTAPYDPPDPPAPDFSRFDPDQWKRVVTILVGVKEGGGGVAITPSGKIIPIDPPPILEDPTPIHRAVRAARVAQAASEHPVREARREIRNRALDVVARELEKAGVRVQDRRRGLGKKGPGKKGPRKRK